jgi:hypothetical protein
MLTLTLLVRRNAGIITFTLAVVVIVVSIVGTALTPARSATPLGDPNASIRPPNPPAGGGDWGGALPPVARPAVVPVSSGDPGAAADTVGQRIDIDHAARMPDERMADAAAAAIACAVGRDLPMDPDLNAVAADLWRIEARDNVASFQRGAELSKSIGLVVMTNIVDLDETGADPSDPCVFGGRNLRDAFPTEAFKDATHIGVAFFPWPTVAGLPQSSLYVIGVRR